MDNNNLYKISDVVDSEFIRMPLALLANKTYKPMSLEAKFVYSLLLNRLTLSQRNGWLNENNEVYLIYTREEAAETLNITYKKAIAAFKELIQYKLIIETRQGRGFPNIIYIVKTALSDDDAENFKDRFDSLNNGNNSGDNEMIYGTDKNHTEYPEEYLSLTGSSHQDMPKLHTKTYQFGISRHAETAVQDMSKRHIKTCQNSTSGYAEATVQDMPKCHASNINNKKIDFRKIHKSLSVCQEPADRQTYDDQFLNKVYRSCELPILDDETVSMFKNVIDRLYYSESYKVGSAVLPSSKIRSYLSRLDSKTIISAYNKITLNSNTVKNTTGYMMTVLMNSLHELKSDIVVCLPPEYLTEESNGGDG